MNFGNSENEKPFFEGKILPYYGGVLRGFSASILLVTV